MSEDLREEVKENRQMLKKIEMAIPGFRGYREREDLRNADSMLREQIADRLNNAVSRMEDCRKELTSNMNLDLLDDVGDTLNTLQSIESRVRHAEQGYSGLSSDVSIEEKELNKLYQWDLKMVKVVKGIKKEVDQLHEEISGQDGQTSDRLQKLDKKLRQFNEIFDRRMDIIRGIDIE